MVKKGKLLVAFDAHKGRDYDKERQKKLAKAAEKKKKQQKQSKPEEQEEQIVNGAKPAESNEDEEQEELNEEKEETGGVKLAQEKEEEVEDDEEDDDIEGEEEEDDIPLSDLSGDERADVIPHQRLTINNSAAINTSIKRIAFITAQTPFSEHNSLVSTEPVDVPDPDDDLTRELAFYKVCQSAAIDARRILKQDGVQFTRPTDYFAEMVKNDEHMTKIKKKLYDEAASKKSAADARRQRDLKKFGKQVQIAKLQQRLKEKKETLEKISSLKRKRKTESTGPTDNDDDLFDVAIDNDNDKSSSRRRGDKGAGGPTKRAKKDEKYGFGGKKRFAKSGDAESSADIRGFSVQKMKGGSGGRGGGSGGRGGGRGGRGGGSGGRGGRGGAKQRPGKNRRMAMK